MKKRNYIVSSVCILLLAFLPTCRNRNAGNHDATTPTAPFVFGEKPASRVVFLSTQMNPVEEAEKMRNIILKDFPGTVDFQANDNNYIFRQIDSLLQANPSEAILIGATHGDLTSLYEQGVLRPLNGLPLGPGGAAIPENIRAFGRLDGGETYYVPWMQASFVMAANKKALAYLPPGSSLEELTYDQLYLWAKNIFDRTGRKALGFPAGRNGLMHRFLQGYLYPSFTRSTLLKFRSTDACAGWAYLKDLWAYVNPRSLVYSSMAEPLLTDDAWIAWDHTARLVKAFKAMPDEFIAFPAPAGPKGRGFMQALTGLAVPARVTDVADAAILLDYLTRPEIQYKTLVETGFFPVVDSPLYAAAPPYLQALKTAADEQAAAPASIPTLLPIGLGENGGDYNNVFMFTFSEIVLEGKHIQTTLEASAEELQRIIDANNVRCWPPDISEERPCKIE